MRHVPLATADPAPEETARRRAIARLKESVRPKGTGPRRETGLSRATAVRVAIEVETVEATAVDLRTGVPVDSTAVPNSSRTSTSTS